MSDLAKWKGGVLRVSFARLLDQTFVLPRGPPESAPFDSGEWWMSCTDAGGWGLYLLTLGWTSNVVDRRAYLRLYSVSPANARASINFQNYYGTLFELEEESDGIMDWSFTRFCNPTYFAKHVLELSTLDVPTAVDRAQEAWKRGDYHHNWPRDFVNFCFSSGRLLSVRPALFERNGYLTAAKSGQPARLSPGDSDAADNTINPLGFTTCLDPDCHLQRHLSEYMRKDAAWIAVKGPDVSTIAAVAIWLEYRVVIFADKHTDDNLTSLDALNRGPLPTLTWERAYWAGRHFRDQALKRAALHEFERRLTVANVGGELFGPMSAAYADVREAALKFAVANWDEARETEGMVEMFELANAEKLDKGQEIAAELFARL